MKSSDHRIDDDREGAGVVQVVVLFVERIVDPVAYEGGVGIFVDLNRERLLLPGSTVQIDSRRRVIALPHIGQDL